jgi:hypothetical protein
MCERLNAAYLQGVKDERERWTQIDEAFGPHAVEAHGRPQLESRLRLATSRYAAGDLIRASGLLPIAISVDVAHGLAFDLAGHLGMLAPRGLAGFEGEQFDSAYRRQLDHYGPAAIGDVLAGFVRGHRAPGAVVLCFEDVFAGETCHRRTFAAWWEDRTGMAVPELGPAARR